MLQNLFLILIYLVIVSPVFIIGYVQKRDVKWQYLLLFFVIFIINQVMLSLPRFYPLNPEGANWNWMGKLLPIVTGLIFLWVYRKQGLEKFNFTLRQKPGSVRPVVIAGVIVTILSCVVTYLLSGKEAWDAETLLYQVTMPGFEEELNFRGIYLGLLNLAFLHKINSSKFRLSYGLLITSIIFGLVHGLNIDYSYSLSFSWLAFIFPFIGGCVFGWMAERTGSILLPIVFHNTANFFPYLLLMVL
jgi:hypothetical protein